MSFGHAACADLRSMDAADVFLWYGWLFGENDAAVLIRQATAWLCPEFAD